MPDPTPTPADGLLDTCDQVTRERLPNFFRLYLNPFVAQACFALDRLTRRAWPGEEPYQSFLANGFDEAVGGAIKLARYHANANGLPAAGLVVDPAGRLGPFTSVNLPDGRLEFVSGLKVVSSVDDPRAADGRYGFVVFVAPAAPVNLQAGRATVIACVNRVSLPSTPQAGVRPDVVVFDESFAGNEAPFAAFSARRSLYDHWNRPDRSTFHSTTFQPNTVAAMHFVRCLRRAEPGFHAAELDRLRTDLAYRFAVFRDLYNPFLAKTIDAAGFNLHGVRAEGHYVTAGGRRVFDAVAGVACSIRGHNPPTYADDIRRGAGGKTTVVERLQRLTGLGHVLPAVSGATAVENALKVGLAVQYPKTTVLALRGGFGGKTLFSLTGTASPAYKANLQPLYPNVVYADPFADDAIEQLNAALKNHPVGVVQLELIQAVGGVRAVPEPVVRYLSENRRRHGYLLFVDEVQTGMYRTGPFARSTGGELDPDLITVGKGSSDMMVPFALTLYSAEVGRRLDATGCGFAEAVESRYGSEIGYRTVANVLRYAEDNRLPERVTGAAARFAERLAGLKSFKAVADVRVFGLLIAVELSTAGWPRNLLRNRVGRVYLMNLLRHRDFPVLAGFCQYEPHVLKLTPPLTVTDEEVDRVCQTFCDVLNRPAYRLAGPVLRAMMRSARRRPVPVSP